MAVEIESRRSGQTATASAAGPLLAVNIQKRLGPGFLLDADFSVPPGITILFGASGSGKTTTLDCVAGLATPEVGRIQVGATLLFDSETRTNLPAFRRRVGYVFQDLALFPHLSVDKNVQYGLAHLPRTERQARASAILDSFRIAHLRARKPAEISGGERQRVALARSLVTDPCVLLLDEPLAALDLAAKAHILDDLRAWNRDHRIPILYVTHSRDEVFALGDRVLVLDEGKIVAAGTPHEVMRAPRSETVAQLAGFENLLNARVISTHEDRGTMTCHLDNSSVELETPLVRADPGSALRIAISAGDILLASAQPEGLSARNILAGQVVSLVQRDVIVAAVVNCGVEMEVHLTLAARDSLALQPGKKVWLIVKTHSCHLLAT